MTPRYDVSVQTLICRQDGTLFADLGTMRWPGVDGEVVNWLAGSCRVTAGWLLALPEAVGPESYTVKYRTIVMHAKNGIVKSDTTLLPFADMTYADVVRFERWALDQLEELVTLFETQRRGGYAPVIRRSKPKTIARVAWAWLRNKTTRRTTPA